MKNSLIIACDGEAASGKSTGAKLISKKYKLLLINSGLFYRYASKIIIEKKPKKIVPFLRKELKKIKYERISSQNLHTQEISKYVGFLAKKKANITVCFLKTFGFSGVLGSCFLRLSDFIHQRFDFLRLLGFLGSLGPVF